MRFRSVVALSLWVFLPAARADGPRDNVDEHVRPIPPPGIDVPEADRRELEAGIEALGKEIEALRSSAQDKPATADLLPDVEIYHKAVRWALVYHEFFQPRELQVARTMVEQGRERARLLGQGKAPWTTAGGLVVRGYISKIDGSVQPYGLVVPPSYRPEAARPHRLDVWFHGRGETLSELNFIDGRQRSPGEFTPPDAFVLHPYGRYCNANKFAGEVDLFEALDHVRRHYPIDENRICVRGFSMGGAACWQFAVHYAGLWAAAAPGAGFSETADFLKVFQNESLEPTGYEKKLWHLYDATDYALNLYQCPVVAYSGEIDKQKQAADMMERALDSEGMRLVHIIGPQTAHAYHPRAKDEINRRIDVIVTRGRDPLPRRVRFTTWTLRYNQMLWVTIEGLEKHWERARVDAEIRDAHSVRVVTDNVSALTLAMPAGFSPLDNTERPRVILDGVELEAAPVLSDRSWTAHFRRGDPGSAGSWAAVESLEDGALGKRHGLQGPIDDAFMDRFLFVRPTGQPLNDKVGRWASQEMEHAAEHWRRQFRGDAPVKNDDAVTDADIASSNLVLWGDPRSNQVLARIADPLPIRWGRDGVRLGSETYSVDHHVPLFVYPNPLNPKRYVVVNSSFTYREYDYLNNARQVPKLPDFAIIDVDTPVSSRLPGRIVSAGFFGERWELPAADD